MYCEICDDEIAVDVCPCCLKELCEGCLMDHECVDEDEAMRGDL